MKMITVKIYLIEQTLLVYVPSDFVFLLTMQYISLLFCKLQQKYLSESKSPKQVFKYASFKQKTKLTAGIRTSFLVPVRSVLSGHRKGRFV